jgi:sphingosine kinase
LSFVNFSSTIDSIALLQVDYYKVKAFRLTPISKNSKQKNYVAIDGEHAPAKPFQVEVHPSLGAVLSLEGRYRSTAI